RYAQQESSFEHISLVDTRGLLVATTGHIDASAELRTRGIGDRPYFQQALSTRRTSISPVVLARTAAARPVLLITSPYFDRAGAVAGAVCGVLDLSGLRDLVSRDELLPGTVVTIVDEFDKVIHTSAESGVAVSADLHDTPLLTAAAGTGADIFSYQR